MTRAAADRVSGCSRLLFLGSQNVGTFQIVGVLLTVTVVIALIAA